jgi:HK97 family phage major capsid protein
MSAPQLEPVLHTGGLFQSFGEQLHAVAKFGMNPGTDPDPRLLEVQKRAALPAGASEGLPSGGGFLVAPEFSREIIRRSYLVGDILGRCFEMPVARQSIKFPQFNETSRAAGSRLGGIQCFVEPEAATLVDTKPNFELSSLTPKKLTGLLKLTDELAMDSDALTSWATYAFSMELTFTFENLIVNGTGAGQPLGVVNAPATVYVGAELGQGAGTVVNANVTQMRSSLWAPSRKNAIWLYNTDLLPQLAGLTTVVGTAGSQSNAWHYADSDQNTDRLCGISAFPSEYCQAPGTPGDLILADFSRYVVAMRERLRGEVSIHVLFESDQQIFRFILRATGQPLDNAPVTPLNGTTATSPFVSLARR